jgi:hypothetical protein
MRGEDDKEKYGTVWTGLCGSLPVVLSSASERMEWSVKVIGGFVRSKLIQVE